MRTPFALWTKQLTRFYQTCSKQTKTVVACSSNEYDAIVIGAGIIGSSTAYHLAKRGQKTLLLEQFDFLHQRGSSHGESRTIRTTYADSYYALLAVEASKLWQQAESEIGYRVYFKTQHLDIGPLDDKRLAAIIVNCQKLLIPHHVLNPQQVFDHFSGRVNLPENWIGIISEGGVIKPTKAVSMFQTLAMKNGAFLKDNTQVKSITRDEAKGGVLLVTAKEDKFRGKRCVVTAGPWTKKLVYKVTGKELPILPVETGFCYWKIKEGSEIKYSIEGDFPSFASYGEPYIYGTPSLEFPGLIKVAIHGGYTCDPDNRPWGPYVPLDPLKEWIQGTFGGNVDSSEPAAKQLCMYSMTPDEDYVIDFLGGEFGKDVVVAGGFSGHGFKMGPVIGRILTDLVVLGEATDVEMEYFRIARFEVNEMGNVKEYNNSMGYQ